MKRAALVAGATGLVGGSLLRRLLEHPEYARVATLGRRPVPTQHPRLEQHIVDFDHLPNLVEPPRGDDAFCCLGTTIRAAGSRDAFFRVDYSFVYEFARAALRGGATQFLLVSSVGANPQAGTFYLRVKGDIEQAVAALSFHAVHIFRPSLLLGERAEPRPGERIAVLLAPVVAPLLFGPLRKYRPVPADAVAAAMVRAAVAGASGVHHYEGDQLQEA